MSNGAIPYGRQQINQEDIDAVTAALQADYLTQGPRIGAFEEAFAKYVGSEYAVAVSNGTAALHLNAMALGVKPGDKVITTPITFAASANCVRYCGGEVVFADIDPETYLLDIHEVRKVLEKDKAIKGLIPVNFAGRAVDLEAFRELADEFGLWIIEDACHAPGGYFNTQSGIASRCGSGEFADLAIFSFHPVKHIATGEGGMITTNDQTLYEKLMQLRTHGITRDQNAFQNDLVIASGEMQGDWPGWYMEMQELGYNYRLSDIQAALGISQLVRAEKGVEKRRAIAKTYDLAFKGKDFLFGQSGSVEGHAYHLYVIEVKDRLGLYNHLRAHKVFTQVHYIPTHLMPYYRQFDWNPGDMPRAEAYYSRCLSLPMFPALTADEQQYVIELILNYYE